MAVSVKKKNKAGMGNDQWLRVAILYRWWGMVIDEYSKNKRRLKEVAHVGIWEHVLHQRERVCMYAEEGACWTLEA